MSDEPNTIDTLELDAPQDITSEREVPCAFLPTKRCSFCKQNKPLTDFYNETGSNDGKQAKCKLCARDYRRLWYATHPNRIEWRRSMEKPEIRKRV